MTFVCGRAGVCALGAVVAKLSGDEDMLNYYLSLFNDVSFGTHVSFIADEKFLSHLVTEYFPSKLIQL